MSKRGSREQVTAWQGINPSDKVDEISWDNTFVGAMGWLRLRYWLMKVMGQVLGAIALMFFSSSYLSKGLMALLVSVVSLATGRQIARAEVPEAMRQLLQTNACEDCDLSGANLQGLNLIGANLQGANLQGARLDFADLSRANLSGASLQEAEISGATFQGTNLQGANLTNANLDKICASESSDLELAQCATFRLLQSLGTELCDESYGLQAIENFASDPWIQELCLPGSRNDGVPFVGSSVFLRALPSGVNMLGANLRGANLSGVSLAVSDLRYAQLADANLQDADLTYALLIDAELEGVQNANFDEAFLTRADVGQVLAQLLEREADRARRLEGTVIIGAINRAQQAYLIEFGTFAGEISELDVSVADTETYRYVISQVSDDFAVSRAISLVEGFDSYLGFVDINGRTLVCQSDLAGAAASEPVEFVLPDEDDAELTCPEGWTQGARQSNNFVQRSVIMSPGRRLEVAPETVAPEAIE